MDIQHAAIILLVIRLISTGFILSVLLLQIPLFKVKLGPAEQITRLMLFLLSAVLLFGNVIPVIIDFTTAVGAVERNASVLNQISLLYSFSNAMTSLGSAVLIWLIYKLIDISLGGANSENSERSAENKDR